MTTGDVNATVIDPLAAGVADMHQGLTSKSQGWWLQIQTQAAGAARAFDKIEYLSMLKLGVLTARKKNSVENAYALPLYTRNIDQAASRARELRLDPCALDSCIPRRVQDA